MLLFVRWCLCIIGYISMVLWLYLIWSVFKLRVELVIRGVSVGGRKIDFIERYWIYLFYLSLLWLCFFFILISLIQLCNMYCSKQIYVMNDFICLIVIININNVIIECILYFENLLLFFIYMLICCSSFCCIYI